MKNRLIFLLDNSNIIMWESISEYNCVRDTRMEMEVREGNIPAMIFPIKKRIKTELFLDRNRGLYIQNDIKKTF